MATELAAPVDEHGSQEAVIPFFDGVSGRVYYRAWRAAEPQAQVVFLHGFGEHSGLYHRLGFALNARGVSLWALDEIGHGLTEGERGRFDSLDDLVENGRRLASVADAAEPGVPRVLAGHSVGSLAAALTAARGDALAGLVLSGSPLSPLPWVIELAEGDDLDLDPAALSADPFYLDALENDPLAFTSAPVARTLGTTLPPAWAELEAALPGAGLPILQVHGEEDPIAPVADARAWSERLADAQLAVFAGARHDVLNETVHAEVAERIAAFVLEAAGRYSP